MILADAISYPATIHEGMFIENVFESTTSRSNHWCPREKICTDAAHMSLNTNLCISDDGNPLYSINCIDLRPLCLYGVASYVLPLHEAGASETQQICSEGSVFERVSFHSNWIHRTIADQLD